MDKRYQVFISSTYTDLKDERDGIIKGILSLYHIPIGMEMFSAEDETQWNIIKRTIDESDYYILILGLRYGSKTSDGISFTQKEYEYALETNKPIMSFIMEENVSLRADQRDDDLSDIKAFRATVLDNDKMAKHWKTKEELISHIIVALTMQIAQKPAIGWVRANKVAGEELLAEINELRKQNKELLEQLTSLKPISSIKNIADFESKITLHTYYGRELTPKFDFETTWKEIFILIAPHMYQTALTEDTIESFLFDMLPEGFPKHDYEQWGIVYKDIKTIAFQLTAYGLIETDYDRDPAYWSLTNKGEQLTLEYCTVKANQEN